MGGDWRAARVGDCATSFFFEALPALPLSLKALLTAADEVIE